MQSQSGTIEIPYPPSANRLWRYYKSRPVKSNEYRAWLNECSAKIRHDWKHPTIHCPVHVTLSVGVPDKRKRDLDNRIKPRLDLLQLSSVLEDDNLVHSLSAAWNYDLKSKVIIFIKPLTGYSP
jgi:crossover junction endodeoxyribonuclease RusA